MCVQPSKLNEEVYMKQPKGYENGSDRCVNFNTVFMV